MFDDRNEETSLRALRKMIRSLYLVFWIIQPRTQHFVLGTSIAFQSLNEHRCRASHVNCRSVIVYQKCVHQHSFADVGSTSDFTSGITSQNVCAYMSVCQPGWRKSQSLDVETGNLECVGLLLNPDYRLGASCANECSTRANLWVFGIGPKRYSMQSHDIIEMFVHIF